MRWWSPWLLAAALAYLVLAVVWIDAHRYAGQRQDPSAEGQVDSDGETLIQPDESSDIFVPFSVFNTAPEGLSQAYEYLRRSAPDVPVQILGRAIDGQDLAANGVVFRVATGWTDMGSLEAFFERLEEELEEELDEDEEGDEDEAHTEEGGSEDEEKAEDEAPGDPADPPDDGEAGDGEAGDGEAGDGEAGDGEASDSEASDSDSEATADDGPTPSQWQMPSTLSPRAVEWVRGGGRLVIGFEGDVEGLVSEDRTGGTLRKVFPLWPEVQQLAPPTARVLRGDALGQSHAVLLWDDAPLLSRWPLGNGEIIWLATPEILQNQHLGAADHLALLQALAGSERTVYFDETLHGTEHSTGTLFLLGRWRLLPWFSLWLLACLALWWRHYRAVGPPEDPYRDQRSEAVDMVDSLASLYGRALRRRDALQLYHRGFVEQVGWRLGLQGEDAERKAEEFLDGPLAVGLGSRDISTGDLQRQLQRINEGFRRIEHGNRF